jgi:hypothetical protein
VRRLGVEALVILTLVAVAGGLLLYFGSRTVHNKRPIAGANIDVSARLGTESHAAFAVDPSRPRVLFGASNQRFYASVDGGRRWRAEPSPRLRGGCMFGAPQISVDSTGREYLAFLVTSPCGDVYTPYLAVASRSGPEGSWSKPVRLARATWKFGFDDAPALAVGAPGHLYAAWTRSLGERDESVVVSTSRDGGRRWSSPVVVGRSADHPHSASIVVGPEGEVVVAGVDATHGIWAARSLDDGRTFGTVRRVAPLAANPAADCGLTGLSPVPTEESTCAGPDPTVLTRRGRLVVVYGDAGANRTLDVLATVLDAGLRPVARVQVSPPDSGRTQQLFPAAAVDSTTGALWACWYDTAYSPHAHGAWYTCAASKDGRSWSSPLRAAAVPTDTGELYALIGQDGLSTSVVARAGVAHAFWIDNRDIDVGDDVFTTRITERRALAVRP